MSLLSRSFRLSWDRRLTRLGRAQVLGLAVIVTAVVAAADFATGYELAMSLFYLGPVALAAWYAGRVPGIFISVLSCASWYLADSASGHEYSHAGIPLWNSLVRLGIFLGGAFVLSALHATLLREQRLARVDSLTGLFGRRAFEERLEHDLALARRQQKAITLAYVDLDDFKKINDTYGHLEGDRVLTTVAQVLARTTRSADTVARLGGDEFAIVLPDTDASGAKSVVEHLTGALEAAMAGIGRETTCSIGVVIFQQLEASAQAAVSTADALMYEVKRAGKGAVAYRVLGEAQPPALAEA